MGAERALRQMKGVHEIRRRAEWKCEWMDEALIAHGA